jgi:hypothetical protein
MLFAAVHKSLAGTKQTCWSIDAMSAFEAGAEENGRGGEVSF